MPQLCLLLLLPTLLDSSPGGCLGERIKERARSKKQRRQEKIVKYEEYGRSIQKKVYKKEKKKKEFSVANSLKNKDIYEF